MSLKSAVPKEINEHLRLYSKEPWEVQFGEECEICGSKIDEFGLCGCGTGEGIDALLCLYHRINAKKITYSNFS